MTLKKTARKLRAKLADSTHDPQWCKLLTSIAVERGPAMFEAYGYGDVCLLPYSTAQAYIKRGLALEATAQEIEDHKSWQARITKAQTVTS